MDILCLKCYALKLSVSFLLFLILKLRTVNYLSASDFLRSAPKSFDLRKHFDFMESMVLANANYSSGSERLQVPLG